MGEQILSPRPQPTDTETEQCWLAEHPRERCDAKERELAVFQGSRCSDQGAGTCGLDRIALLRLPAAHSRGSQCEDLAVKRDVMELGTCSELVCMVVSKVGPLPLLLFTHCSWNTFFLCHPQLISELTSSRKSAEKRGFSEFPLVFIPL